MEGIGWLHPPIPASGALGQRGALSVSLESWPSTPNETKEAHGAAISPPARRLPLVGDWMARGSMAEGIGWLHSPIPASIGALRRRGALRGSRIVALDAKVNH